MLRREVTSVASARNSAAMCRARNGSPGNNTVSAISPGAASMCGVLIDRASGRVQQATAGCQWRQAQVRGHGLTQVGETVASAQRARCIAGPEGQRGNALAGVVAARPGGIATVVGAQHQQVTLAERGEKFWQACVEMFKRRRV